MNSSPSQTSSGKKVKRHGNNSCSNNRQKADANTERDFNEDDEDAEYDDDADEDELDPEELLLVEQENRDLDFAIRESEKEREVIQVNSFWFGFVWD